MHNADEKADRTGTSSNWMNRNLSGHTYLIMVTMTRFKIASVSSGNTDDDIEVASGGPKAAFLNAIVLEMIPLNC